MTVNCQDAAAIPKVSEAGCVVYRNENEVQIMHNGVQVISGGYCGAWMTEIIHRLRGHHEPQEEIVFQEIVNLMPDSPKMIELGCNWAYYSLWMLQERPQATVIGVEPDPKHLDLGRRNAALNGRSISFVNASVGAQAIQWRLFQTETMGVISIPQVCVPQLMAEAGLAEIDVLHCDIQGAETEVLNSCRSLFEAGAIRFCIVSTHHHSISGDPLTHQRCLKIIEEAGGNLLTEHNVAESFSGDGLIAAYFGKESLRFPKINMSYNRSGKGLFRDPLFDLAEMCR
ncbi:FkbM family methyltransferase [Methylobacterium sp. J-048]|uniref:FkbM family methyltransferase n=1 Tax=Methylobacterium sp. J-048 TaxID=2836635 RepID=UPI001FB9437B|nr:FkbM family methyltransferase [Methylobacterium sp. J-048]MCJ2057211.1 FkbM family methyltransferase [Methylobacterium sp. J-048]